MMRRGLIVGAASAWFSCHQSTRYALQAEHALKTETEAVVSRLVNPPWLVEFWQEEINRVGRPLDDKELKSSQRAYLKSIISNLQTPEHDSYATEYTKIKDGLEKSEQATRDAIQEEPALKTETVATRDAIQEEPALTTETVATRDAIQEEPALTTEAVATRVAIQAEHAPEPEAVVFPPFTLTFWQSEKLRVGQLLDGKELKSIQREADQLLRDQAGQLRPDDYPWGSDQRVAHQRQADERFEGQCDKLADIIESIISNFQNQLLVGFQLKRKEGEHGFMFSKRKRKLTKEMKTLKKTYYSYTTKYTTENSKIRKDLEDQS